MFHLHPALPLDIDALWSLRTAPVRVIAPNRPPSGAPRRCRLAMPACKRLLAALEDLAREHEIKRLHFSASMNAVPFYQAAGFVALREEAYAHPSGLMLASMAMEKVLRIK